MANQEFNQEVQAIIDAAEKFNDDFKALLVAEQENVKRAASERDAQAYKFAAGLLDLALLLDPETVTTPLVEFYRKRGQRVAKEGDNPYAPFVKAVCAVKEDGKWKFNPKQASFAKYANIVRQLVEDKRAGRISGSVVAHIESYKWNGRSKLGALEARDRFERPNASSVKRVEDAREKGRKARPVAILDTDLGCDDDDVVFLWGVVKDGKLEVMKSQVSNDDAPTLYYQLGKELSAA